MIHRPHSRRARAQTAVQLLVVLIFFGCTQPPVVTRVKMIEPDPSEGFISYSAQQVTREIQRLRTLLLDTSVASEAQVHGERTRDEIMADLFELTIHRSNPSPDYEQAFAYAAVLYKTTPTRKLYYLNWGRLLKAHIQLKATCDSLARSFEQDSKKNRSLSYTLQSKERRIDSLMTIIQEQNEKLEKLKRLDLMMEKQRSTIQ